MSKIDVSTYIGKKVFFQCTITTTYMFGHETHRSYTALGTIISARTIGKIFRRVELVIETDNKDPKPYVTMSEKSVVFDNGGR
jgi:hypothetical protein